MRQRWFLDLNGVYGAIQVDADVHNNGTGLVYYLLLRLQWAGGKELVRMIWFASSRTKLPCTRTVDGYYTCDDVINKKKQKKNAAVNEKKL